MVSTTRVSLQPAYILHYRPYRDTSCLIEALTRDFGRIGLVAKGARTAKSRLSSMLQPFRPLLMSWAGRGELATLTSCESNGPACQLSGRMLISGFYINELLLRLLHRHDPHAVLFDSYATTLYALEDPTQEQRALRIFEKHLLQELGYALVLNHQADTGEPLQGDRRYSYRLEQGPVCYEEGDVHNISLYGHSLMSLGNEQLDDALSLREIKPLMRAALSLYLGDKPLHSRNLLRDFRKASASHNSNVADAAVQ